MSAKGQVDFSQTKDELRARGIRYCLGAYVDIHGVPKAKCVPIEHFEHMMHGSELFTGYALDGLGQAPNDDEISAMPDLERMIQLPWQPEIAWLPADNYFHGEPYALNTRVALKRVLGEAAQMGFSMNLGVECEIYVLKLADGKLVVPDPADNLSKAAYDIGGLLRSFPFLDRMVTLMNGLGWDVYSFDHEDGHGQFEFDFTYADALTMCDRYIFWRYMVKHVAQEFGLTATFMPKPFADKTGNGAHFNMSLADAQTGRNLFAATPGDDPHGIGLSRLGHQYVAGLLHHGRALCAVLAPTVNSYKRLVRRGAMGYYSWAPIFNSFGTNNRSNSLRIPMGGGRCEYRNADSSLNPYLAATLCLAAGLEGIREGLDPGAPHAENLYEMNERQLAAAGVQRLPRTLGEAVEAFEADPFVERVLGTELRDEFVRYKREEWEEYHQHVSDWEIRRYAQFF
ncbi:MAG: type III glutamate--ammonia ligase [Deltaproteobacteria bacterium]|nr:type III glutamate--ammonia ligase [Deltaproteobacteria bacterium]